MNTLWAKLILVIGGLSLLVISSFFVYRLRTIGASHTQQPRTAAQSKPVRLLFVGDMMFDRHIREVSERNHDACYPFQNISQYLQTFDGVIGNNEGPITANASKSVGSKIGARENYTFTFDPEIVPCYRKNNFIAVGIGNNHIMNFGQDGVRQTIDNLRANGMDFFGNPLNGDENYSIKTINEKKLAFVAYNYAYGLSDEAVATQITQLKPQVDVLFIFAHWGKEYDKVANEKQTALAHKFIDAGADVVIGMHPHVIQNEEIYKDKHIFYSLGNFIFDQYFQEETKKGLGIGVTINLDNALSFDRYQFNLSSPKVQLMK